MLDKINIQNKLQPYIDIGYAYVASLRDIRNVGMLVFTMIVLLISWSGVKSIQANYGLQKQITQLSEENQLQSLENTNLALQNQYLQTNQYVEISARENLGLGAAGETELLVTKKVALAHTVKQPQAVAVSSEVPQQSWWQRNFQAWINFFLHRGHALN